MKYFFDTEFHEYHKQVNCCGIKIGKPIPTIDLISIGIMAEDGRTYYAISKDFNIKDAWDSFQIEQVSGDQRNRYPEGIKKYWLRDNVLTSIWQELLYKDRPFAKVISDSKKLDILNYFTLSIFIELINKYGKTNKEIAKEVIEFCKGNDDLIHSYTQSGIQVNIGKPNTYIPSTHSSEVVRTNPEFYGYYSDYDWVVFCQLFGKMINLPNGFPMYCIDLKQMLEDTANSLTTQEITDIVHGKGRMKHNVYSTLDTGVLKSTKSNCLLDAKKYSTPSLDQTNKHNALADARWNYELYKFLNTL